MSLFIIPGQVKLASTAVLVVGAGGLGCPAGIYLAAAGVGRSFLHPPHPPLLPPSSDFIWIHSAMYNVYMYIYRFRFTFLKVIYQSNFKSNDPALLNRNFWNKVYRQMIYPADFKQLHSLIEIEIKSLVVRKHSYLHVSLECSQWPYTRCNIWMNCPPHQQKDLVMISCFNTSLLLCIIMSISSSLVDTSPVKPQIGFY